MKTQGVARHKDLIDYFLSQEQSRKPWVFVAANKFDDILSTIDNNTSQESFFDSKYTMNLNAKSYKSISPYVYQTKKYGQCEQWGHRKDSIIDVVYLEKSETERLTENIR